MNKTILYNYYCKPIGFLKKEELKDGTYTGKSTIDLGFIKYCGFTSKQVADFLEESGFLKEEQAYEKEKALWFDFYLNFNDDNLSHAENSFISNGLHLDGAVENLHKENLYWIEKLCKYGSVSVETVLSTIRDAKRIVDEYKELEPDFEADLEY